MTKNQLNYRITLIIQFFIIKFTIYYFWQHGGAPHQLPAVEDCATIE